MGDLDGLLTDLDVADGASQWDTDEVEAFRDDVETRMAATATEGDGLHPWTIAATLSDELSADAEITVDAGAHMLPLAQAWRTRRPGTF